MTLIIVDVEADGPIPTEYSWSASGRVTAHTHNLDDARGNAEALKQIQEAGA